MDAVKVIYKGHTYYVKDDRVRAGGDWTDLTERLTPLDRERILAKAKK